MKIRRTKTFKKQYQKLPLRSQQQFDARLKLWLVDPKHPSLRVHQLQGNKRGYWSLNVTGDLRALYYFEDKTTVVFVLIGTHSQLY